MIQDFKKKSYIFIPCFGISLLMFQNTNDLNASPKTIHLATKHVHKQKDIFFSHRSYVLHHHYYVSNYG